MLWNEIFKLKFINFTIFAKVPHLKHPIRTFFTLRSRVSNPLEFSFSFFSFSFAMICEKSLVSCVGSSRNLHRWTLSVFKEKCSKKFCPPPLGCPLGANFWRFSENLSFSSDFHQIWTEGPSLHMKWLFGKIFDPRPRGRPLGAIFGRFSENLHFSSNFHQIWTEGPSQHIKGLFGIIFDPRSRGRPLGANFGSFSENLHSSSDFHQIWTEGPSWHMKCLFGKIFDPLPQGAP